MADSKSITSVRLSKPELFAQWLFNNAGQFRNLLAFLLIAALTLISIKFNIELGRLSAVDETSKQLLPTGYALLDLSCLFLSGYVGIKSQSIGRKAAAWGWFIFLLCLSLWAAASFTLSIDARANNSDLEHRIEQQRIVVDNLNSDVLTWKKNVAEAVNFKSKHQKTLESVQVKQRQGADTLHALESELPNPTMAIYEMAAPVVGLAPALLNTVVRLLWAGALTLSPIVIMLLVGAELSSGKAKKVRRDDTQKNATLPKNSATQDKVNYHIEPVKGNNWTTPVEALNGLKYVREWLKKQEAGRVTRHKIALVSKLKSREAVGKIIDALIDENKLERLTNGHLTITGKKGLTLITGGLK